MNNWSIFNHSLFQVNTCLLCDSLNPGDNLLCPACKNELPWLDMCCWKCANPLNANPSTLLCGQCQKLPPPFGRTISLFHYRPPADYLLQQLKFNNRLPVAQFMAETLLAKLEAELEVLPQAIIPVPLHKNRLRERGFNQALEIAKPISRELAIPIENDACIRTSATEAQSDLNAKQRQRNIRNAFWISQPINAMHVAIVDDVMTTGATVSELARVLKKSGVSKVDVWTVARAGTWK